MDNNKDEIKVGDLENSEKNPLFSTWWIIFFSICIAILLVIFVFQSFQVSGPSMETTLHNSDRLIVWKLPETWSKITGHPYVPNIGDIIIFNSPSLGKQLIKRVIALPGDRVHINNGVITVYDKQNPKGFHPDTTLPYSKGTTIPYTSTDSGSAIDITLQPGTIFVCGDNRTVSEDSRILGPINLSDVVGKLILRIYPLNKVEIF